MYTVKQHIKPSDIICTQSVSKNQLPLA